MKDTMAMTRKELDLAETDQIVAALSRRCPAMLLVMQRTGNPDDGADKLSIYFETHSCCDVHNCINAGHLCALAQQQLMARLEEHLGGDEGDDGEDH